jgi:ABC-type transport system involved in cytochrome bd biosynthesis fused ATPase/permease subunit
LNYLTKKLDSELSNYKSQNNYFDKLLKFFSTIGMPIILLFFSIISKSLNWEEQIIILVAIISFILFIYKIKKMIDEWLNKDFRNLEVLKDNLESMLIRDFL